MKKQLSLLLGGLLLASSLVACGAKGSTASTTAAASDKVDASFPKENISIYVAPGRSGVGVKAAVDGTADFDMLARDIKDKEKESLGKDYKSFEVAKDALTVSVSSKNHNADKLENSFFLFFVYAFLFLLFSTLLSPGCGIFFAFNF